VAPFNSSPSIAKTNDEKFMQLAIEQAKLFNAAQDVNPRVGAVLVNPAGEVVATGFHRGSGSAHAEIAALNEFSGDKSDLTLFCTLEPCNATGRTGPCAEAIVQSGIKKVVIGQTDLNPIMSGGANYLREHGVVVIDKVFADECAQLNSSWNFAQQHNRPWVVWKIATSLDGFIAAKDGSSQWITSAESRSDVQKLRATVGAIITGTGTALADDPALTVREFEIAKQPLRVVVGSRSIPETAKLATGDQPALQIKRDISEVLTKLWTDFGIHRVLVEAGPGLAKSLWQANLINEVYWYQAPLILGSGQSAIGDFGITTLSDGLRFSQSEVNRVGLDVLIHFLTN
jgi:diaminohydroxyphosphoribosylaminopyrimidine deaminase/5-amino-6-(5-phosphoribosylamino)uracil reductase